MKKAWVVAAVACAVVGVLLAYYIFSGLAQVPPSFEEDDLNVPVIDDLSHDAEYPGPISGMSYPWEFSASISRSMTIYADFGGVLELFLQNEGSNDLYVHHYRVGWEGGNSTYQVNCSRLVPSGHETGLGVLYFAGPGEAGPATLEISMEMWASSANGAFWDDLGEMDIDTLDLVAVQELPLRDREVQSNPVDYYNKVNQLIDLEAVDSFADQVLVEAPGDYGLLQILKAYELVSSEIEYVADADDHWQSPSETISLGTGDCEDHSLLLTSLITALGGTCRVNLISGHAFPTVYVGNATVVDEVVEAVQAYYGNQMPIYYTVDDLGYWLVVDTNGMPYAGGCPAAATPVGPSGGTSWNFDSGDWIMLIDVTGETVDQGLF